MKKLRHSHAVFGLVAIFLSVISVVGAETTLLTSADAVSDGGNYVSMDQNWDGLGVLHGEKGSVAWDFEIEDEREYHIQVLSASGGIRPCRMVVLDSSGKEIFRKEPVLDTVTGGFHAKNLSWRETGSIVLVPGAYKVTFSGDKYLPHFRGIRVTADASLPTGDIFRNIMEKRRFDENVHQWSDYEKNTAVTRKKLRNILPDTKYVLFIKRPTFQSSHYYTDFIDGCVFFGSELCLLNLEDGSVKSLVPALREGIIGRCNLSFDAKKVIFDYKAKIGEGFRIWEVGIDGTGLRQLTFPPKDEEQRIARYRMDAFYKHFAAPYAYTHHTDDMHPAYLPDGGFMFVSTRCEHSILCDGADYLTASVLYRCNAQGEIEKLSDNSVSESCPTVMEDGRVLYTRWEYVDNGSVTNKGLWAVNPDGTASVEIYGANIAFPAVFNTARQVPGRPAQFVCIGAPHMPLGVGTVLLVDSSYDRRSVGGVRYITPDVDQQHQLYWQKPEKGDAPFVKLFEHKTVLEKALQCNHDRDGGGNQHGGPLYMDPFPLNEHEFLVSYNVDQHWNKADGYALYLINDQGERELLFRVPEWSAWNPIPVRAVPTPSIPSATRLGDLSEKNLAQLIVTDVYAGMDGVPRGTIKYLRINEHVARPWSAKRDWPGDEFDQQHSVISMKAHLGLKVQHGIVPVEEDGSANFLVPADKNIFLQALDENYREVQRERTFVNYRPGEVRSCVGCHEQASDAPAAGRHTTPLAIRKSPVFPGPQPGEKSGARPISYFEDVQPVLDRHCVQCHNADKADGKIDLSATLTERFNRSYETLMQWNSFPVIGENHPKAGNNHYMPPYSFGSPASRLIKLLDNGHYDVKMPLEDWVRLTTWVDSNGQYYGTYFGRKNLRYKDRTDFRPVPTFEETQTGIPPLAPDP